MAMKNIFAILLLAAILVGGGGCGDSSQPTTSHDSTIEFSPRGYELLFTHGILHEIEIVMTQEEWDGLIQDMKDYARTDLFRQGLTGNYREATFIYKGPAGDAIIEEVGFRTKGHYTRPIPEDELGFFHRAYFRIRFNEVFDQKGQEICQVKDVGVEVEFAGH